MRGKVALLIANQDYTHKDIEKLQTAEKDVHMLAVELRRLEFHVLTLANLTLREMQEAQDIFCNHLLSQFAYCIQVTLYCYFAYIHTLCATQWIHTLGRSAPAIDPIDVPHMCQIRSYIRTVHSFIYYTGEYDKVFNLQLVTLAVLFPSCLYTVIALFIIFFSLKIPEWLGMDIVLTSWTTLAWGFDRWQLSLN